MNKTENEIFDWIIDVEDKLLEDIRKKVILLSQEKYGDVGSKVAIKYYNRIDGIEDVEVDSEDECPECLENAKKLSSNLEFTGRVTEFLMSDAYNYLINILKENNIDFKKINNELDFLCQKVSENTLYHFDFKLLRINLLLFLLKEASIVYNKIQ